MKRRRGIDGTTPAGTPFRVVSGTISETGREADGEVIDLSARLAERAGHSLHRPRQADAGDTAPGALRPWLELAAVLLWLAVVVGFYLVAVIVLFEAMT